MQYKTLVIANDEIIAATTQDADTTLNYIRKAYARFNTHATDNVDLYAMRTMHDVERTVSKGTALRIPLNDTHALKIQAA